MSATSNPPNIDHKNVVLVGFMGSGKTAVGTEIASRLGWEFVDTDDVIETRTGRTIPDIFDEDGEDAFRDLESDAVRESAKRTGVVISVGGGAVLRPDNVTALRRTGVLFLLDATPEAIYERISHNTHRPLLDVPDPVARIRELMETRRPFYGLADVIIDTTGRTVPDIADALLVRYLEK